METALWADIAIVGLGVMGENLALNFERNGFGVAGFDLDAGKRDSFSKRTDGKRARALETLTEAVGALKRPRKLLLMVPAGVAVDAVLAELRPLLEAGDVVIDGGNTRFTDTERRMIELEATGILYVGSGVSGGEEGALRGPAIMPGGNAQAWPLVQPLLQAIAAKAEDGSPCCNWMGPGASGHFVKMVHNGIEYADMQMICEAYFLLQQLGGMQAAAIGDVFGEWNRGDLSSYLVDITSKILAKSDADSGQPLVDMILDTAEQKGTGKWASQVALDLGVTAPTIAEAVFARTVSAIHSERLAASGVLTGPQLPFTGDRAELAAKVRDALLAAKACAYAQGFALLRAADEEYVWQLPFDTIAATWRAGCIIRAKMLEDIRNAYARNPSLANLLVDDDFAMLMARCQPALRDVVSLAAQHGVPVPAFMSALAYFDSYRCARLPANLLQAQRDFFGAHTYRRIDRPGKFHTAWTQ